ncbi:MAG: 5'-nucleotidase C-terminal domain-containing protein [Bdellovibrionales bacterium]|nr:5'-nucleotidase C-terminal domain-containing protein [Bdellovibrionales bacterium]
MLLRKKSTLPLFLSVLSLYFAPNVNAMAPKRLGHANQEPIKISFLLTNDIHGHIAPKLTYLGAIADQLRQSSDYRNGKAGLFILDSGDQFQGTLLSNYDEGASLFNTFNEIGYDAIVPGNHDYDFGPLGWLYDRVNPDETSADPREVIKNLASMARFPLLSANTYFKDSILAGGHRIRLDDQCKPSNETPVSAPDFQNAKRPEFLKPYQIVKRAGVRVALIGLDNRSTSSSTTKENVSDLCFRDEVTEYLELRRELEGKADLFVILLHQGDTDKSFEGSEITKKINAAIPNGVHLVAAGHTHFVHNANVGGVRVIQDGANGKNYGRVDLYFDPISRTVNTEKTDSAAGISIENQTCDEQKAAFACKQLNLPLHSHPAIDRIVEGATLAIAPLAKKKLAFASAIIRSHRIDESPLANLLTDALRKISKTQVALMNTGGIRAPLQAGDVLYENLFEVLPFQNQAVILTELPWETLRAALLSAIQTCGRYGTLAQSGLRIRFTRDCSGANGEIDLGAKLLHVSTLDGQVLLDSESGKEAQGSLPIRVATLDFIASGGSGFTMFSGARIDGTLGITRELIAESLAESIPELDSKTDGRFLNVHHSK